jgi:hypothetical protein
LYVQDTEDLDSIVVIVVVVIILTDIVLLFSLLSLLAKYQEAYEITLLSVCLRIRFSPTQQAGRVEPEEMAASRQGFGKPLTLATNTHATIEVLLDTVLSARPVSYQIVCM